MRKNIESVPVDGIGKRIMRKVKKILLGIAIFLFVLFLLFCIFIANPFASSYPQSLATLVKSDWDFAFYLPHPKQSVQNAKSLPNWAKILNHPKWMELPKTQVMQSIQKTMQDWEKNRSNFRMKTGLELEDVLDHFLGKEIILAGKFVEIDNFMEKSDDFATNNYLFFATRVSFLGRTAYGVLNILPSSLQERIRLQHTPEGYLEIGGKKDDSLFLWLAHDVLLVSKNKQTLNTIQKILSGELNQNITSLYPNFSGEMASSSDIVTLLLLEPLKKKMGPNYVQKIQSNIKIREKKISIQVAISPNHSVQNELQSHITMTQQPKVFPQNLVGYSCMGISWKETWQYFQKNLDDKSRQNFDAYIRSINTHYHSSDFVGTWLSENLEQQVLITMANTNFAKARLAPFDRYPNISLIIPTKQRKNLLPELADILTALTPIILGPNAEQEKITLFSQERYAGRNYLRIKWPDTTGGAVHPVIGMVDDGIMISTHETFFKDWQDAVDSILPGKPNPYLEQFKNGLPTCLYLNASNIGVALQQAKEPLSRIFAQKHRGPGFETRRKRIETNLDEMGLILSVLSPEVITSIEKNPTDGQEVLLNLNIIP